jgi:hypothetical protein
MTVRSSAQLNAEQKKMQNFIMVFCLGIILPLLFVAFTIIILAQIYKLNERRDIYKRLHIMGMSYPAINGLLSRSYYIYLMLAYGFYALLTVMRYITETGFLNTLNGDFFIRNLIIFTVLCGAGGVFSLYYTKWLKSLEKDLN